MRRLTVWVLALLVLVLAGLGAYWVYGVLAGLEARVARLEETVSAQSEALKALGQRVSGLEQKLAQQEAPPLSLPEAPTPGAGGSSFWAFLGGLVLLLLALYLLLGLLRRGRGAKEEAEEKPREEALAESRMVDEGAPPGKEGESR
jgi:hypothetical protein